MKADVLPHRLPDVAQLRASRRQITADVSAPGGISEIGETVQHEQPGEEEVPTTPRGKIAIRGQCDPARKATALEFTARIAGEAEDAGCVEFQGANSRDAGIAAVVT